MHALTQSVGILATQAAKPDAAPASPGASGLAPSL